MDAIAKPPMPQDFESALVRVTKQVVSDFRAQYVRALDSARHCMYTMYRENSTVTWNGNVHAGRSEIAKLYGSLPACKTSFESMDVQPVPCLLNHNHQQQQQNKRTSLSLVSACFDSLIFSDHSVESGPVRDAACDGHGAHQV